MTRIRPIAAGAVLGVAALLMLAGPANAHVTVVGPGATQGGSDQEITFRVPVERNADTVGLKLALPTDTPIASVEVLPVPGWTHAQTTVRLAKPVVTDDGTITEAVGEIDWTALPGHGLAPGEFGAFTIIAGQLPKTPSLTFRAIQVYSDHTSVSWIETAAPASTVAPEYPAPTLQLAAPTATSAATPDPASSPAPAAMSANNTGGRRAGDRGPCRRGRRARRGCRVPRAGGTGVMRLPWPAVLAGTLVAAIGCAGLVRAAAPPPATALRPAGGAPIVVSGAYVRQPAPPTDAAAAYFTVYNTTARNDRLLSVVSGAGRTTVLHVLVGGRMSAPADGVVVPAHGRLVLSTGTGHAMIENLFGPLEPGQNVNLQLTFADAGPIAVDAPVIALGAPAPSSTTPGASK